MPTRNVWETIRERTQRDPDFRRGLLREIFYVMLQGDAPTACRVLKRFVDDTLGFSSLAHELRISEDTLQSAFEVNLSVSAEMFFRVMDVLSKHENVRLHVRATPVKTGKQTRKGAGQAPERSIAA